MPSLTRRRLLTGVAAAALAPSIGPAIAAPFHRGAAPAASGTALATFQITETAGTPSLGAKRIGLCFRVADSVSGTPNDVPAGNRVRITRGGVTVPAQFDNLRTINGALQFCTACLFDAPFSAGETRTYTVVSEVGAFNNATTGTLADITGASDFNVVFTSIVGSTTGAIADLTASFNTHAAVPTRVTQYEKGPYCDSWEVWGMAGSHGHLQTVWYVSNWKDGSGNSIGIEVCGVVAQQWWSLPFGGIKEKLTYDAAFMNGATTIQSYANVAHCYMAQWATVRMQNDHQHAARHWIGASRPTLLYKPDQAYWIHSGLVPSYQLGIPYTSTYINTYTPGGRMSHIAAIGSTGGYIGRGILGDSDVKAFVNPTPANIRIGRANAFAGLSIPKHRHSNRTRQRPGDATSDIANTFVALPIKDFFGTTWADFTADGMPISVQAYTGASPTGTDGYVTPTGGTTSGTTAWSGVDDTEHIPTYSYFMYLYEGERYFLIAEIGNFMGTVQGALGNGGTFMNLSTYWTTAPTPHAIYPGATNYLWDGVVTRTTRSTIVRATAWMANCLSCTVAFPDNDPHANYYAKMREINAKFVAHDMTIANAVASDVGAWSPSDLSLSPWMETWIAQAMYTLYDRTKDSNWLSAGHHQTKMAAHWVGENLLFGCIGFHQAAKPDARNEWNATTNDWFASGHFYSEFGGGVGTCAIDSATGVITTGAPTSNYFSFTTGDEVIVINKNSHAAANTVVPTELSIGTIYYIANPGSGTSSFQLATNPDGTGIISFASDYTDILFGVRLQDWNRAPPTLAYWAGESFFMYSYASIIMGKRHGSPYVTPSVLTAFKAAVDITSVPASEGVWNFSDTV